MNKHSYGKTLATMVTLLVVAFLLSCNQTNKPSEKKGHHGENGKNRERLFYAFDPGFIARPMHAYDEGASMQPRIFLFDNSDNFNLDILNQQNPYTHFGYKGFLYHREDRLLLLTSWVHVAGKKESRLSVLDDRTFSLIKQETFRSAPDGSGETIPSSMFAVDEHAVFMVYDESRVTMKLDIETGKWHLVEALGGRSLSHITVLDDKVFAAELDQTSFTYKLICFDPKTEKVEEISIGEPYEFIGWDGGLVTLGYRDRKVAIYSATERSFVVPAFRLSKGFEPVSNAVWDPESNRIFLTFNQQEKKAATIYSVPADTASTDKELTPAPFGKLDMQPNKNGGRTVLFVDHHHRMLFAFYFHSDRYFGGARVAYFDLKKQPNNRGITDPDKVHIIGAQLGLPPAFAFTSLLR